MIVSYNKINKCNNSNSSKLIKCHNHNRIFTIIWTTKEIALVNKVFEYSICRKQIICKNKCSNKFKIILNYEKKLNSKIHKCLSN